MIFAARGLLVSLAFFAVVYCSLSLLVVVVWRGTQHSGRGSVLNSANLLFGLRLLPFIISAVVTLFFTLPSFWMLERVSPDEDAGTFMLAMGSLLILTAGLFRVLRAQARTTRAVRQWRMKASTPANGAGTVELSASLGAPPLILVGIRRPEVMVSDVAAGVLTVDELKVAVRHELGHAQSWDNLKKVLVNSTPFPGMSGLEDAWHQAAELAADDAAVANRQEALNLAAALIKLSRSSQCLPVPILATGLLSSSSSISLRVERLLRWRMTARRFRSTRPWTLFVLPTVLLTMIVGIASHYNATLILTHRLTELLVP